MWTTRKSVLRSVVKLAGTREVSLDEIFDRAAQDEKLAASIYDRDGEAEMTRVSGSGRHWPHYGYDSPSGREPVFDFELEYRRVDSSQSLAYLHRSRHTVMTLTVAAVMVPVAATMIAFQSHGSPFQAPGPFARTFGLTISVFGGPLLIFIIMYRKKSRQLLEHLVAFDRSLPHSRE